MFQLSKNLDKALSLFVLDLYCYDRLTQINLILFIYLPIVNSSLIKVTQGFPRFTYTKTKQIKKCLIKKKSLVYLR